MRGIGGKKTTQMTTTTQLNQAQLKAIAKLFQQDAEIKFKALQGYITAIDTIASVANATEEIRNNLTQLTTL